MDTVNLVFVIVNDRGGLLDELWGLHFRGHFKQQHISSQIHGSKTAHCLTECSQHILLVTPRTTVCWGIH